MISAYDRDVRQPTMATLLRLLKAAGYELQMHLAPYDDHDDVLAERRAAWPMSLVRFALTFGLAGVMSLTGCSGGTVSETDRAARVESFKPCAALQTLAEANRSGTATVEQVAVLGLTVESAAERGSEPVRSAAAAWASFPAHAGPYMAEPYTAEREAAGIRQACESLGVDFPR